ncbi:hypothetical protein [Hydrogenimonas cancrithermarum]|uniref:Polysaccharide biosynthesis protein n=1 Tax=Hydrogenimonas cancrithermarum TaxID=2993563 RepID=A0ABN6WWA9_9BACT|nr:hypothetical protein [Hydrogenimonas cancrithermarum]BDY13415.1 hypothetical protein HCR_17270 [Hydrogenimonas cancrithermarum]
MKFFAISFLFSISFSFIRLKLSTILDDSDYAFIVVVWSMAMLIASQLLGGFPRLYPKYYKNNNIILLDKFSITISLGFLLYILYYQNYFIELIIVTCFLTTYEYLSYSSLIHKTLKNLILSESSHLFVLVILMILSLYDFDIKLSIFFTYGIMTTIVFFLIPFPKIQLNKNKIKNLTRTKLSFFLSQANTLLLLPILYMLFSTSYVAEFALLLYIVSLPSSVNQLAINRIFYSKDYISDIKAILLIVTIICFFESIVLELFLHSKYAEFFIKKGFNVGFGYIFIYILAKGFYTSSFVFTRIKFDVKIDMLVQEITRILFLILVILIAFLLNFRPEQLLLAITVPILTGGIINYLMIIKEENKKWK